jgi:hypothetical protein
LNCRAKFFRAVASYSKEFAILQFDADRRGSRDVVKPEALWSPTNTHSKIPWSPDYFAGLYIAQGNAFADKAWSEAPNQPAVINLNRQSDEQEEHNDNDAIRPVRHQIPKTEFPQAGMRQSIQLKSQALDNRFGCGGMIYS